MYDSWRFWSKYIPVGSTNFKRVTNDTKKSLKNIAEFLRHGEVTDEAISSCVSRMKSLQNDKLGRQLLRIHPHDHQVHFSEATKDSIRFLYKHFPDSDFSPIDDELIEVRDTSPQTQSTDSNR